MPDLRWPIHSALQAFPSQSPRNAALSLLDTLGYRSDRFDKELSNGYFWVLPQVGFPADLEPDKEKSNATGIIHILNSHQFTIDQEVALDPEFLGKVFEDLLPFHHLGIWPQRSQRTQKERDQEGGKAIFPQCSLVRQIKERCRCHALRPDAGGNRHRGGHGQMNPPSERRFPCSPLAQADAGASPGVCFFEGQRCGPYQPRAMPWAGMGRTVGAEETERDLLFHDTVAPHLAAYTPEASAAQQRDFLTHLHQTLIAPSHPISNRFLRITVDSPDLLATIKQEGNV